MITKIGEYMIRINQIKIPVDKACNEIEQLKEKIQRIVHTNDFVIEKIVKKSIDARDKSNLIYIYCVDISSNNENVIIKKNSNNNNIMLTNTKEYSFPYTFIPENKLQKLLSPVIIGAGPAGYFCALNLSRAGLNPIVIERGEPVEQRSETVSSFWNQEKPINPNSNVSFGEGGAGTFSDGKLNTGIKDKMGRIKSVIDDFISFGAPYDIAYLNKPHIGTNELKKVLSNMRKEIIRLGGKIYFNTTFVDYERTDNNIIKVKAINKDSSQNDSTLYFNTNALVLAIGHSARDTFTMLYNKKLPMESKAFAIGVRIEHKRAMIDEAQYGNSEAAGKLPAADYKMTYRSKEGRSVYSFCMCPGGFVVNASSDINQAVVNGMSNHARDEENSNSAIVVNVTPDDFIADGFEESPLSGMYFQQKYEKLAFDEGKGAIPVQLYGDFKQHKISEKFMNVIPNIKGKYTMADLNNCLPAYVNNAIIEAIEYYDSKLSGFSDYSSVLSGIESRTSSPVRIVRNDELMSEIKGIFPCGEGAGYAGGITSAAVDGIKVAESVAKYYKDLNN